MAEGKVKASKVKVHQPPEGVRRRHGHFHVYIYDVFNKTFAARQGVRHRRARGLSSSATSRSGSTLEQEADPELFDLPLHLGRSRSHRAAPHATRTTRERLHARSRRRERAQRGRRR